MIKRLYSLLIFCSISSYLFGQSTAPVIAWQRPLGGAKSDEVRSMRVTPDGGCVITGYSASSNGDVTFNHGKDDCWIAKLDVDGSIQWQNTYGGSHEDWGRGIRGTIDGGYIVAGTTMSNDSDIQKHYGAKDYLIIKVDSIGNVQWLKDIGGSLIDVAYRAHQLPTGDYIVFGGTRSTDGKVSFNYGNADYWVVKLNKNGNIIWDKSYGGSAHEEGSSLELTSDGGYFITGYSNSVNFDVTGNHGDYDAFIIKTDGDGNIQWKRCYGGSSEDAARDGHPTSDGGYVFAGYTKSDDGDVQARHGNEDVWVVKLDSSGNIMWSKALGGSGFDYAYYVCESADSGFLVAGYSSSGGGDVTGNHGGFDCWVLKLDKDGNILWQRSLGGSDDDRGRAIQETPEGDLLVAGYTHSNDGDVTSGFHGGYDGWLVKLCFEKTFYADADSDGYGNKSVSFVGCKAPFGYVTDNTDCDDQNSLVNTSVSETCNSIDDNCNGLTDEAGNIYYADADGDGFGDPNTIAEACSPPTGFTTDNLDCNDGLQSAHPGAVESCNSIDDDCNGLIDDNAPSVNQFYLDKDGDGYGIPDSTMMSCIQPPGFSSNDDDCNDLDFAVNPSVPDLVNGIDDNCNGQTDELNYFYADVDEDGYGNINSFVKASVPPPGYVADSSDCNDENNAQHPGATEQCNGIDDNCNGVLDDPSTILTIQANGPATFCSPGSVELAISSGYDPTMLIQWKRNQGLIPGATNTSYLATLSGGYSAVMSNAFCTIVSNTIVVKSVVLSVSVSPSGLVVICEGDKATLVASTTSSVSYQWFKNDEIKVGATNSSYTTTSEEKGTFKVQITDVNGCTAFSNPVEVSRLARPESFITPLGSLDICLAGQVSLLANSGIGFKYKWYKNGKVINNETSQTYVATVSANYKVKVTNADGCNKNSPEVTVFTSCREEDMLTSTESSFSVFPNPASDFFIVDFAGEDQGDIRAIELYDAVGKLVFSKQATDDVDLSGHEVEIPMTVVNGSYFVKIIAKERTMVGKLSVVR